MKTLKTFKHLRERTFQANLAIGSTVKASNVRGNEVQFSVENFIDENNETYWATDDSVISASVELILNDTISFNCLMLQEYIALGQRIESFIIEQWKKDTWLPLIEGTTIGHKRILIFPEVITNKIRLTISKARACPLISHIGLYQTPIMVSEK
ncbi:MAG: hypothetical protein HYZ34_00160 [Ignavibacteriae bacterium]|nr:hypothetical protein [Ignavibacteriota bacterium]